MLTLLSRTWHQSGPYLAWFSFAWAALDRLHAKGMIGDQKDKRRQGAFTAVGGALTVAAFKWLFDVDGETMRRACS